MQIFTNSPNFRDANGASPSDHTGKERDPASMTGIHVMNPPDNVPKEVRDFIRLQNEKAGRETGEIFYMLSDEVIEEKYLQPGTTLKKLRKKDKEKEDYLKRFLAQMEEFFITLFKTYKHAVEVKTFYHRVRNDINAVLETLDDKTIKKIMPKVTGYKAELDAIHDFINDRKRTLRMENLTERELQKIHKELEQKAQEIASIEKRFRKRVTKAVMPDAASAATAVAATASLSHAPDILSAMHKVAEDHTPHYHTPIDEAMPLRFSTASAQKPSAPKNEGPQTRPLTTETEEIA